MYEGDVRTWTIEYMHHVDVTLWIVTAMHAERCETWAHAAVACRAFGWAGFSRGTSRPVSMGGLGETGERPQPQQEGGVAFGVDRAFTRRDIPDPDPDSLLT